MRFRLLSNEKDWISYKCSSFVYSHSNTLRPCTCSHFSKRENQTSKHSKNRRRSNALTGIMCYSYRVEICKHDEFSTLIQYIDLCVKGYHSLVFFRTQIMAHSGNIFIAPRSHSYFLDSLSYDKMQIFIIYAQLSILLSLPHPDIITSAS